MDKVEILKALRERGVTLDQLVGKDSSELQTMLDDMTSNVDRYGRKIDPNAFDSYKEKFGEDVTKYGFESTYLMWACGQACGCMGPQGNEPFCPCEMRSKTASMFGKVVPL